MRELINIITESRGLGARRPGEVFVNDAGQEIRVNLIDFFPEEGGQYSTAEELQDAVDAVVKQLGVNPVAVNLPTAGTLAFGIAMFDSDTGPLVYLKYFKNVVADTSLMPWDNQTGIPGYKYASKAAVKTRSQATPQDILADLDNLAPEDILAQVAAKFPNSSLITVTQHLVSGGALPFKFPAPVEMELPAFQDYFCELLQPIALMSGQVDGEADKVEQQFLDDETYALCSINFGKTKTEGLSDSIMISPSGRKIKVSTKGGNGAAASSKNILDAYNELQQTPEGMKLVKKVSDTVDLINTVVQAGQYNAPLLLAVKYGIIDEDDTNDIRKFKQLPRLYSLEDAEYFYSPRIRKLTRNRKPKDIDNVNVYYHAMAAVAHKVAEHINNHTGFSKDASLILNHSALIQVYSKVTSQGKEWTLQKFNSKWPGSAVSAVVLDAGKNYMSTQIKGNFTFVVDPTKKSKGGSSEESGSSVKMKDPGSSMSADRITRPGRRADLRDKDTTPRQKRD